MQHFSQKKKIINIIDLGVIDYKEALQFQERLLLLRKEERIDDTMLILEHMPVITIGKRGNQNNILASKEFLAEKGVKVCSIGRGGDVTYHGPGQIVGYPIIRFQNHVSGVRELVRNLEEIFIQLLDDLFDIKARRDSKHPGVWVENDKITAIGLSIQTGITMHGFAFNVNTDLKSFQWILSCGIADKGVTSIKKITEKEQDIDLIKKQVVHYFGQIFNLRPSWKGQEELRKILEESSWI
jgi:lipoyl(octanoyl) transferase